MNRTLLSLLSLMLLTLSGCGFMLMPTEADAKRALQKWYDTNSNDKIEIAVVTKTNGLKKTIDGTQAYEMSIDVISYRRASVREILNGIPKSQKKCKSYSAKVQCKSSGTIIFIKTDNGWMERINKFSGPNILVN